MLRVCNRTNQQTKKNDHLDILTLLDKCTYILKDDKMALRIEVKDQGNPRVIDLLNRYKKKGSDLQELQLELRKLLHEIKGTRKNLLNEESITLIKRAKSNDKLKENSKRTQDFLVHHQSPKPKPHDTNRIVPLATSDLVFLKAKPSPLPLHQADSTPVADPLKSDSFKPSEQSTPLSPFQEQEQNIQFLTIVSQTPNNQEFEQNTINEQSGVVLLKYNAEEINSYHQITDFQQNILQQPEFVILQSPPILPTFESFHFRKTALPEYRHLFTDWNSILSRSTERLCLKKPTEDGQFRIEGATPEQLFEMIFPNSFTRKTNFQQMKQNLNEKLQNAEIDYETLFELCDKVGDDQDEWVSAEEIGSTLENVCVEQEQSLNRIKELFNSIGCEQVITLESLSLYLQGLFEVNTVKECEVKEVAKGLFSDMDIVGKGYLSYWDMYNCRESQGMKRLLEISTMCRT